VEATDSLVRHTQEVGGVSADSDRGLSGCEFEVANAGFVGGNELGEDFRRGGFHRFTIDKGLALMAKGTEIRLGANLLELKLA
jgi:hypothetical protein